MKKSFQLVFFLLLLSAHCLFAQETKLLQQEIQHLVSDKNATVGVTISGENKNDALFIKGEKHFPMQSVFKLPIILYVLSEIDSGKFSLGQNITIAKKDLLPNTWSPIREKYPDGVTMPLSEIIKYTVSESDNNGADILLRLIGNPQKVETYLHSIGIKSVSIKVNEEEMHKDWNAQFKNWITPEAANKLLRLFYYNSNHLLSENSYHFIWKALRATQTGKDKIKAELPENAIVAHKTGSSGTNKEGITAAENDIGVVTLPNGNYFFICVFITNSKEKEAANKKLIAAIAKSAWGYYATKKN